MSFTVLSSRQVPVSQLGNSRLKFPVQVESSFWSIVMLLDSGMAVALGPYCNISQV